MNSTERMVPRANVQGQHRAASGGSRPNFVADDQSGRSASTPTKTIPVRRFSRRKVVGSAEVRSLHSLASETLWRRFGDVSGLSRAQFFEYFGDIQLGFFLALDKPKRVCSPVSLERLRTLNGAFQPPQFFQHLDSQAPLVSAFTGSTGLITRPQAKRITRHNLSLQVVEE